MASATLEADGPTAPQPQAGTERIRPDQEHAAGAHSRLIGGHRACRLTRIDADGVTRNSSLTELQMTAQGHELMVMTAYGYVR